MTNDMSRKECTIKSNLLNDDSSRPHFVVKFLVVMSLEGSLTVFVTHFTKYSGLVSQGKQSAEGRREACARSSSSTVPTHPPLQSTL